MNNKLIRIIFGLVVLFFSFQTYGQNKDLPQRPDKKMAVNDFAGLLSGSDQAQLERQLRMIYDTTQLSIVVIVVKSLNGYEINDFATRTFESWGIGQKGKDNGFLILVKVKTSEEKGKVYIVSGYGGESFLTDALAERIVEKEILPSFKEDRYAEGLSNAANAIVKLAKGYYTPGQYMKKKSSKRSNFPLAAIVIVVILLIVFMKGKSNGGTHYSSGGGGSLPCWLLLGSMMGGNRSGGFGDFSSGGGDFGSGGDSDFGGFGGGNTGGGGAGGEW